MSSGTNVGNVFFKISSNRGAFTKEMQQTASGVQGAFGSAMKSVRKSIGVAFSVGAVISFGKKCVQVASETQSAWAGLSSIINGQGKSFDVANSFIQDYISDGLVPLSNAVTAYKNLAARGYDQSQIAQTMTALKDSAAFGRQATLSYGQAIQSATEGLKNENSVLVDNAGVTKNVAKMWDEYARSIGTTVSALTQQQKIQAEVNGIMRETQWQTGDAARYSQTFAGGMARISATALQVKTAIGNTLIPILNQFLPIIQTGLELALKFCNAIQAVMASFGWEMPDISDFSVAVGAVSTDASQAATNTEGIGKAAETAAKKAKKAFASFDEINVLSKPSSDASSGSGAGGAGVSMPSMPDTSIKFSEPDTSGVETAIDRISEKINAFVASLPKLEFNADWEAIEANLSSGFSSIWSALGTLTHTVLTISIEILNDLKVDNLILKFSELWAAVGNFIDSCAKVFGPAIVNFYETAISPLVQWVGEKLADAVSFATGIFDDWAQWFEDNTQSISDFAGLIAEVVNDIWSFIEPLADAAWEAFKDILQTISDMFQNFFQWILDNKETVVAALVAITTALIAYKAAVGISAIIEAFKNGILAATVAEKAAAVAQWALNAAMNANPIGIIIALVAGLAAGFVVLWNKSEAFRNFFINMWQGIKKAITPIINGILSGMQAFVNGIIRGINFLIRGINKISFNVPDWVPGIGGKKLGFNLKTLNEVSLPRLAEGGWVAANNPQLAVIGDNTREGEIVTPESKIREQVEAALAKVGGMAQKVKLELELIIKYPDGRTLIKRINEAQVAEGRILLEV